LPTIHCGFRVSASYETSTFMNNNNNLELAKKMMTMMLMMSESHMTV